MHTTENNCNVQCAMCNVQCAMYNVQCAMCNVQCTMCNVQCTMCNVQCAIRLVVNKIFDMQVIIYYEKDGFAF